MLCTHRVGHSSARSTPIYTAVFRFVISAVTWVAFLGIPVSAWCADVNLQWDPVVDDPMVTGYQVHYGLATEDYTWAVEADADNEHTSSKTVGNLLAGNTYYFAVRSRNHDPSLVSAFSNEVSATIADTAPDQPVVTNPGPQSGTEGDLVSLGIAASDPDGDALTYTAAGLPTGLSIDAQSGLVSGTLAGAGTYNVTVTVSDGSELANASFSWVVNIPHVPLAGLVAAYGFEEAAGTAVTDASGNGNDGLIAGATRTSAGRYGSALSFDGVDDLGSISDAQLSGPIPASSTDPAADFTITAWVKPDSLNLRRPILSKQGTTESGSARGFLFTTGEGDTAGKLLFELFKTDAAATFVTSSDSLVTNQWQHVAVTYKFISDGGSQVRLYIDGQQVGASDTAVGPIQANAQPLDLGAYIWSSGYKRYFDGLLDEACIYDKVLTAADIQAEMTQPVSGTIPEPVANQPPEVTNPGAQSGTEGDAVSLGIAASDPDGDALTYTAAGLPTGLSINAQSGLVSGTLGGAGTYNVAVTVSDGSELANAGFTWAVSASNQPPVVTNPGLQSGTEGDLVSLGILTSDPDGDATSCTAAGLPTGLSIDAQSGLVSGTLASAGTYGVTVTVSDGSELANTSFTWVVSAGNQPPVVTNPGTQSGTESDAVSLDIAASDPDGDALTYTAAGLPTGLSIDAQSGLISGTLGSAGTYSAIITVSDGSELTNTGFSWGVSAGNQPPVVTNPGPQSGAEGDGISLGIAASDPDGDALTFTAAGLPTGLSIDAQSGLVSGTLASAGTFGVIVTASDGTKPANTEFTWVVSAAGQPPTIRTEAGVVLAVTNTDWTRVDLEHTYDSMVVVATARYSPSAPPQIVRVQNASGSSFELGIARVDGSTGDVSTVVDYLVVEEGVYDAATHGVKIEAVRYTSTVTDSSVSWAGEQQAYANSYTTPVVIGQVMSANDALPSSFWARGDSPSNPPNASTLYTGKTVSEDPDQVRADELIGYIVIEAGTGILGNRPFEAGVGTDSVQGMGDAPSYEYPLGALSSADVALLSMAAMDGYNGGWPVLAEDLDPSGAAISLAVDEDQLRDSERAHTTEQIAYLVLGHAVVDGNRAPLVTTPPSMSALEGAEVSLQIEASDPDGDALTYSAAGLPTGLSIDAQSGLVSGTLGSAGTYTVTVTVSDGSELANASFNWVVNVPHAPLAGLVAAYGFEEAAGTAVMDASGNGNDGLIAGATRTSAGRYGSALSFDGVDDLGSISDAQLSGPIPASGTDPAEDFTITAWVKPDSLNLRRPILSKQGTTESGSARGFLFSTGEGDTAGKLQFELFKTDATATFVTSSDSLVTNQWQHVAVTYKFIGDGSSQVRLYIDGQQVGASDTAVGPIQANAQPLDLGAYIWSSGYKRHFDGLLDEACIYDEVLTAADIQVEMTQPIGATSPGPGANQPPVATNPGTQSGTEGDLASLGIAASDPDGDALTFTAAGLPPGLSIDAQSGLVSGRLASAGTYGVTVTVSDGSELANAGFTWMVSAAGQPPTIRTEAGVVLDVKNTDWTRVDLEHTYDSMVVVATARYSPSAPPQIVRVQNASGSSFELGIARVDGSTGDVSTVVDYLVVEEGVYDVVTHGVKIEAVRYTSTVTDSSASWAGEQQAYANSYTTPVVIGQVMSAKDALPSSFWARGGSPSNPPNASTLYTGKTVSEDPDRVRADELIGYIVIEAGTGTLGNRPFEAGVGTDSVQGMGDAPSYEYPLGALSSADVALLSMAAMDGYNGGWPVLAEDLDPSGATISLAVDEDQLRDSERAHTTEQIAYLVMGHAVVDGNRAPLVTTPPSIGALEGAEVSLQIEAVDPDGDELSYWASGLPFGLSIDPGTGLIEGTIGMGESGVFEVIIEVDDGTSITDVSFDFAVAIAAAGARAQIGVVTEVSSETWTEVVLSEIYASMVVVTTPSYTKNDAPAVVQIRNAFADSFEVRMARRDGGMDPLFADVHYLVVEEGVYNAADHGVTLEAVKYISTVTDAAGSWIGETRTYANAYAKPVVLGQVMSANDEAPSSFWTSGESVTAPPSATDLNTGKTVAEDPNRVRADETIGYLVLEAGPGNLDGLFFEAGTGADIIVGMGDGATPVSYSLSSVGSASVALATLAAMDGYNGGWAVLPEALDSSGASLALGVDEDTLSDDERNHTTEQVGYIVFE